MGKKATTTSCDDEESSREHYRRRAERFARGVLDGSIVAGRKLILAVQRNERDLETGHERGLYFSDERGAHVCEFFERFLCHSQGEWGGSPIDLEDWEVWWLWTLFGWMRANGTRRFRHAYQELARKNGKSLIGAGIGLYMTEPDGEPGARVYSAATKREQAKIVWEEAVAMLQQSPRLQRYLDFNTQAIFHLETHSRYVPISADAKKQDGFNVHCAIVDELHEHPTRKLYDVLTSGMGARRSPLLFMITTAGAGSDRHGICYEQHDYACKVLDGIFSDDSYFALIYTVDPEDEWNDEACWRKANPNLGISPKLEHLREECRKAERMPAQQNNFKRKHLNIWTESETRAIDMKEWDACDLAPILPEEMRGRRAWIGLDLANLRDITALLALVEPREPGGMWDVIPRFYVPADRIVIRSEMDRVPYPQWRDEGWLIATPGSQTDHGVVVRDAIAMREMFRVVELAFDRWGSPVVVTALEDGGFSKEVDERLRGDAPVLVQFGQGFASMGPAWTAFEEWLLSKKFNHAGNPILRWMASNVVTRMDPAGLQKPDKSKSGEKIDGIVALIMAIDRASRAPADEPSVYDTRGMLSL